MREKYSSRSKVSHARPVLQERQAASGGKNTLFSKGPSLPETAKPQRAFLVAAAFAALGAFMAYLFEGEIARAGGSSFSFAVLLAALVMIALFLVLCYRLPKLGARLLGREIPSLQTKKMNGIAFLSLFKSETGAAVKAQHSARKQARHQRKYYAKISKTTPKNDV